MGHLASTAPERLATIARRNLKYLEENSVVIDITKVLPLKDVKEAHRLLENRGTKGKLLLQVIEK
jgi:NADPH:quinone reductase-like Zn-dependent oxidoreductase